MDKTTGAFILTLTAIVYLLAVLVLLLRRPSGGPAAAARPAAVDISPERAEKARKAI